MQVALIGFSKSGKTTVFNALTGSEAEVSAFATGKAQTHRAVVEVPDDRLDKLCKLYESKKLVHATIDYLDPVGIRRDLAGQGEGLGDDMLHTIANADALVAVVRAFEDESGIDCDPEGDTEAIQMELILSDLTKVENRLERVEAQAQRIGGKDRDRLIAEGDLLKRLKESLEAEKPIRALEFTPDEDRLLRSFQFLTSKQLILVLNMPEGEDGQDLAEAIEKSARERLGEDAGSAMPHILALCGETEMEISRLDAEERTIFLEEYGIEQAGADRMIRMCYDALGLISFFTAGPTEAHAWTIEKGTPAVEAAGTIHSDLQRGFIRAQVVRWDDLLADGSTAEAKKNAHLRVEGKDYIVQDGDVIEIMFNV
ncbi:MAG: redox-regulated ATPase YchF [Candidatus Sumerlaeia bacterium]